MTQRLSLTQQAHNLISERITDPSYAIDATVGNGYDTQFLSHLINKPGIVFGFDIQQQAIETTQNKIAKENLPANIQLFNACHSKMLDHIADKYYGKFNIIMFNLGYLPGSDKTIITQSHSTLLALEIALKILASNGIITIAAYPGHQGGKIEKDQVKIWGEQLDSEHYDVEEIKFSEKPTAPVLFIIQKKQKR